MEPKLVLEKLCRHLWEKLNRSEKEFGIGSPEANSYRKEWSALDRAFQLVYEERIDYYNIGT